MNENGGWSTSMLNKIEKEIPLKDVSTEAAKAANPFIPPRSYDPAPSAEQVAQERLAALLADVTTTTLDQLRELRDEIDSLMQVIRDRDSLINKAFTEHVAYARNAITCKEIIKENLKKIKEDFTNGLHPIPQTVTIGANKDG
jgi:hypothetical protein